MFFSVVVAKIKTDYLLVIDELISVMFRVL